MVASSDLFATHFSSRLSFESCPAGSAPLITKKQTAAVIVAIAVTNPRTNAFPTVTP
jgi:hypothetical protein